MDLSPNPESPPPPGSGGGGSGGDGGSGAGGSGGGGSSSSAGGGTPQTPSRYEAQKRRDWNTFGQYLRNHRPPLSLAQCSGAHVLEFLRYLDQFGKTKVHMAACPFFGHPNPPAPCPCPLRQAWGSLDALVGRLRAAFYERHGSRGVGRDQDQRLQQPDAAGANPFAARAIRLYLRDVRDAQARARGISFHKKKKKRKGNKAAPSSSKNGGGSDAASEVGACAHGQESKTTAAAPVLHPPPPPLPPCLTGVPFECCDIGGAIGGGANAGCYGGFYLPLLFNASI